MKKRIVILFTFVFVLSLIAGGPPIEEPHQVNVQEIMIRGDSPELQWIAALLKGRLRAEIELNNYMMYAERPNAYEMKKMKQETEKNPDTSKKEFQPCAQYIKGTLSKRGATLGGPANTYVFRYQIIQMKDNRILDMKTSTLKQPGDTPAIEAWADQIADDIVKRFVSEELMKKVPEEKETIKLKKKIEALEIEIQEYRRHIESMATNKKPALGRKTIGGTIGK